MWVKTLDAMAARKPAVVAPGHMAPTAAVDATAIRYSSDYLVAFDEEVARATDSAALIAAMTKRDPDAGTGVALHIGAKVAKGEMKWVEAMTDARHIHWLDKPLPAMTGVSYRSEGDLH